MTPTLHRSTERLSPWELLYRTFKCTNEIKETRAKVFRWEPLVPNMQEFQQEIFGRISFQLSENNQNHTTWPAHANTGFQKSRAWHGLIFIFTYLRKFWICWEQNILWLEVTVDNVLGVEMLQGDQDLGDEELGDPLRQSPHLTRQNHLQHVSCTPVIGYKHLHMNWSWINIINMGNAVNTLGVDI